MRKVKIFGRSVQTGGKYVEGKFHGWGSDSGDDGTFTVAIVEMEDGTVELIYPIRMQFIDEANQ